MLATRRRVLTLGAAAAAVALTPLAAAAGASGARELTLYRGDTEIGKKRVAVRREGDEVFVSTDIAIDAKLLGITVYSYRLAARETWRRGSLISLDAETDDNGTPQVARARRVDGALRVEGSAWSGTVPGDPATTSYWSPAFLERPVWISTQDGRLLNVTARNLGPARYPTAQGEVAATRWAIGGDLQDLFLYYDAAGEWLGTEFPARGETARFVVEARGPALTPLWVNA
jgi:hypothetical protein